MSKDNPVASLDPITIINDLIEVNKSAHIPRQYVRMRLNQLKSSIKRQNAVETNKVQPNKCNCDKGYCIMQNNAGKLCTYKNVICNPEYFKG